MTATFTDEGLVHVPGMLSRWVQLPTGVKAHYMTSGEYGPAVVLLHGGIIGSSGMAGWRYMAPFLGANGFRVYCPDMPRFGLTHDPGAVYGPGYIHHADYLHDFTRALCLDSFHLAGNSMGCANAVNYLMRWPEKVKSFALIAGGIGDLRDWQELVDQFSDHATTERKIRGFDGTTESMYEMMSAIINNKDAITPELIEMRTQQALAQQADYMERVQADRRDEKDPILAVKMRTKGRLEHLEIPGIYLYGRDDIVLPVEAGYAQEDALPNVQFFYPEATGHQGQTDQPEIFNRVFLEFFRDGKVSWQAAQQAGISTRRPVNPKLVDVPRDVLAGAHGATTS